MVCLPRIAHAPRAGAQLAGQRWRSDMGVVGGQATGTVVKAGGGDECYESPRQAAGHEPFSCDRRGRLEIWWGYGEPGSTLQSGHIGTFTA